MLFLSFWDLCLDNLPEGHFVHRRLTAEQAKRCIQEARHGKRLIGACGEDLFAPYHRHERLNHEQLCGVLQEEFGIVVSLRDFVNQHDGGDSVYFVNPLQAVQLQGQDQLLVVTCSYGPPVSASTQEMCFAIERGTVSFHLIERSRQAGHREVLKVEDFTEADLKALAKMTPPAEAEGFDDEVTR